MYVCMYIQYPSELFTALSVGIASWCNMIGVIPLLVCPSGLFFPLAHLLSELSELWEDSRSWQSCMCCRRIWGGAEALGGHSGADLS